LGAERKQRSAGWYVGALLFWLLCAWLIAAGLVSLVPQIFGPAYATVRGGASCAQDLHDLARELLDRVGAHVKDAPRAGQRDTLDAFFTDFDRRLMHVKPACTEPERAAFTELSRLRHGMGSLVERFEREELPHVHKLNLSLNHADGVPPRN
jgi:hypothetical protein